MVPLLFAFSLSARADVSIPPPAGKRFLAHDVRIDGLAAHPDFVVVAFDGPPGDISAHRLFTADAPQQTLAHGASNRGGSMGHPALHLLTRAAYDAWDTEQRAKVDAQRTACAERGEGCAHISRFVPSYSAPPATVPCTDPIDLKLSGLATGPDTVVDVFTLKDASATACTLAPAAREQEKGGQSVNPAGCSALTLSGTSVLAGLGLLFGLREAPVIRLLKMAWRNVWRNSRRSTVTIAAMTLGLWVTVNYSGMVEGMLADMATSVTDMELGEVQIVAEGYREDPGMHRWIDDPDGIVQRLQAEGYPASARQLGGGLGAVGKASAGIAIIGLDVAHDAQVTELQTRVDHGQWLDPADPKGVVIGGKLARVLDAKIGDELLVLSQGIDGSIANDLYTVRGTLSPVGDGIDRTTVLMNTPAFRELMVMPQGAHQITVRVPQDQDLDAAKARMVELAPGTDVQTWRELLPMIAQWLDSTAAVVAIMYFIIYPAIAILVLNAMLMAVFERIREFGVMKAIGYPPATVFWLITAESAVQATAATVLGLLLAAPVAWYLQTTGVNMGALAGMNIMGMSMLENWKGVYTVQGVATPVVMLWFMVMGAAMLPALRAASIQPVTAMRYR